MTTSDEQDTEGLKVFFEAAKDNEPQPSDALLARIMADADAVADTWETIPAKQQSGGWLHQFLEAIGGWQAASGIVTAGFVGLVVGISPPQSLSDFASGYLYGTSDGYLVDPYDGFDFAIDEG